MGHWYTKDGEAKHWIEKADGSGTRDTTLRDAKKLNLFPSVTEIINTLDKPALTRWKLAQVTNAAFNEQNKQPYETYEQYHAEIMSNAFEQSTDARDRGSEIHNCLEFIIGGNPYAAKFPEDIYEIADAAFSKLVDYCETSKFEPEKIVVGKGYAGMVDAHNGEFVIDWKTKDIDDVTKRLAWDEHAMQLAAYAEAIPMTDGERRCINVFIDRTEPGKVVIHEWSEEEIELAWQKFQLLVKYWQLAKNHNPEA